MTIQNNYIIANNVAIVQSPECANQQPVALTSEDLSNCIGTVFLAVVNSMPVNEEELCGHTAKLLDLCSDRYRLIKPLSITLSEEDNSFVITSRDLNLFGYGNAKDEAIQDLREVIVEYYEELLSSEGNLGKIPDRDKKFLDQIIKKCS